MSKLSKNKSSGKAYLSWNKADFLLNNEKPPDSILDGKTEGELMSPEDIEFWCIEEIKSLSVIRENYPEKFKEQYRQLVLDLDYFFSLGKITKEECENLKDKESFSFGNKRSE